MSDYNKTTDRDKNGRINRKYTANNNGRLRSPKWWRITFINQKRRCLDKRICRAILNGKDPDSLVYPLGNNKPHLYYW